MEIVLDCDWLDMKLGSGRNGRRPRSPRKRWEDNIKMDSMEIGYEDGRQDRSDTDSCPVEAALGAFIFRTLLRVFV
jgi:hypothetical protein